MSTSPSGAASAARPEGASNSVVQFLRSALDEAERVARDAPSDLDYAEWPFWIDVDYQSDADGAAAWRDANRPAHVLRVVQSHREILDRYETAIVARDAAVDTPLAGATRMALRIREEAVLSLLRIYRDVPGFDPDWIKERR